ASILRVRLTRQVVQIATISLFFVQFLEELLHVVPRHRFDWKQLQLVVRDVLHRRHPSAETGEVARVPAHDGLPLVLRHIWGRDLNALLDLRHLSDPPPTGDPGVRENWLGLAAATAHVERPLRQTHERQEDIVPTFLDSLPRLATPATDRYLAPRFEALLVEVLEKHQSH